MLINRDDSETVREQKKLLNAIYPKLVNAVEMIPAMRPEEVASLVSIVDAFMFMQYRAEIHDTRVKREELPFDLN
jgi:hypothetical protein